MRVFFSAGEASGDAFGAALLLGVLKKVQARPRKSTEDLLLDRLALHYGILDRDSLSDLEFSKRMDDIDSLGVVEQIMKLEDEFAINIKDEEYPDPYSYAEMVRILGRKVEAQWPAEIQVQAVGSRLLKAAGAQIVADSSTWGAIGIAESIKVYPQVRRGANAAIRALKSGPPGVFVPIDFGRMNITLARIAKAGGWKVVYFSPPGAWRRDQQGKDLPVVTDAVITPFSWSAEILNRMGANAHWFGHPIRQMIRDTSEKINEDRATEDDRVGIAVLPGSRKSEIELILPLFAETVREFSEPAEVAVAATLDLEDIRRRWKRVAPNREDRFTVGDTHGVLRRARAALVCSGTATLEAALCDCPHLVAYRVTKLVEFQMRLIFHRIPFIAQPNILLNRSIVPELLQQAATPEALRKELRKLLEEGPVRDAQLAAFREIEAILGPDDAIDRSVELIAGFLRDLPQDEMEPRV